MLINRPIICFVATTFFSGLGGAFLFPLTTLYLVEALQATPFKISLYLVCSVLSAIVVSQRMAFYSDNGTSRQRLIIVAFACYIVTAFFFAWNREYWHALVVVVTITSISSAAFPQVFAMGREYADEHLGEKGTLFLNTMRASIALAWVCGPPMAFMAQSKYGFTLTFLLAAMCGIVTLFIVLTLPSSQKTQAKGDDAQELSERSFQPWYRQVSVLVFLVSLVLMFLANNLYLTTIPLYLTHELDYGSGLVGNMMGLAALFEIPIMLGIGLLTVKWGPHRLLNNGVMFGCLFFAGMAIFNTEPALLALQLLNGLFVGSIATLGMVVLQDMMKGQVGTATTLFSNAIQASLLLASLAIGILGEYFTYYMALWVCFAAVVISLAIRLGQDMWFKRNHSCNNEGYARA
ncbi:sugar efflux transporter [Photobacterium rosenbergii]|uniref:sugar efflux transporter n=1 Tax=Photobacterium rosenbergii TaxID=294936 RepID=UPI001C995FF8|nr:sugar efflux transporter [Photobacterium rosenbergii]MBY5948925.1 sugar efflux transporter [Photobacterium rosenbergii]